MIRTRLGHLGLGLVSVSAALMVSSASFGSEEEAVRIAEKAEENFRGFGGQRTEVRMILKDQSGAEKIYELVELDMETPEGLRMLLRFKSPKTHEGTALLVREVKDGEDEVWLYLANTQKLNRISGNERTNAFLGSEMDIEQLTFPKTRDYHHRLIEDGSVDGHACFRVEATPKLKASPYGKVVSCIDQQTYAVYELRYYDRAGVEVKVLAATDHKQYGSKWRPTKMVVTNGQTGRSTIFEATSYKTGLKLSEKLFTSGQLRKY